MARVTLFHTSDMHNKLTPELAERLHDLKQAHPDSLMLDSGDAIWSGNIYWRPGGEPVLDLMSSVPYDAMCMGNREFHFLSAGLFSKTSRAKFPVLSANLQAVTQLRLTTDSLFSEERARARSEDSLSSEERAGVRSADSLSSEERAGVRSADSLSSEERAGVRSLATFNRDGIRVTILGLSVPCITERMLVKKLSDHYFEQPVDVAAEIVPTLRKDCDVLIAITHIGIKQDRELAEAVPGIDVILGGHTHTITEQPERVGETSILHSGMYAHYVRKVEIELEAGNVSVKSELIPLGKA